MGRVISRTTNFWKQCTGIQKATIAVALGYALVFIAMLVLRPGSKTFYQGFQNTYQIIAPLWAAVVVLICWIKAKHENKSQKAAWFFIGLGCLSFAGGQTTWTVYESVLGQEVPFPGWPDVGYLGSYPFLLMGVSLLVYGEHIASRARLFLDSAIMVASVAILTWYFLIAKMWEGAADDTLLNKLISAGYPIGDFLAIFIATVALKGQNRTSSIRRSIAFVAAGLAMISLADGNFQFMNLIGTYETGSWADWGWSFGFAMLGFSALNSLWWARETATQQPTKSVNRLRSAVSFMRVAGPYISVVLALGVVILDDLIRDGKISSSVYIEAIVVFVLILLRQMLMLVENVSLSRDVANMNENLESLVEHRTGQLSALQKLTRGINKTLNFSEVLTESVRNTKIALNSDGVAMWLLRDNGPGLPPSPYLRMLEGDRIEDELYREFDSMPLKIETESFEMATSSGKSWKCLRAPLMWQFRQIGMVAVIKLNGEFSHADGELLESIGIEVGTALEHARQHADALAAADHDSVTNLLNHRAVHQRFDRLFNETRTNHGRVAVMMVDLNNFKLFNDTYGHVTGDQVLKRVARVLNEECGPDILTARYGGDEFMVVIPGGSAEDAHVLATRIRAHLTEEGYSRPNEDLTVPISLSFGIACYPNDGQSRHELLTIADSNLYQAKNSDEGIVFTSESQRANRELRAEASFEVLDALITAVDNKDRYTRKHSEDVTEYALWMAEELGLSEETMRTLRIGGLLHDVGKIGVPDEILRKPGRLTDEEFEIMKRHPRLGEMIVGGIPGMSSILDAVRSHHERWDGMGYPDRLKGEDIPFMGRLLAVADAFSAMTTDRPYRKGLNLDKALAEIRANIGTQFDPEMADAFLRAVEKRKPVLTHAEQELPKAA
jgi:diguanylate cyclase (GGDEF)-like protein